MENRIKLADYFAKQGFKVGAEIGVADGRYSEILLKSNPRLRPLYCIDPYAPYHGNWRSQSDQNLAYDRAVERLSKYNANIIRKTSLEACGEFEDGSLDFVFIDGAHDFNNVMLDIILWTAKVRKGGIVSGHDYYEARTVKVIPAVSTFCTQNNIRLNIIPRATGVHRDDRVPCWYFEKK